MHEHMETPTITLTTQDHSSSTTSATPNRYGSGHDFLMSEFQRAVLCRMENVRFKPLPDATEPVGNSPDPSSHGDGNSRDDLDRRLDEALMETFPASDPVSIIVCGRS